MKELIKELTETHGPSGREQAVSATIERILRSAAPSALTDLRQDRMGNLIAFCKGVGGGRRVMVAAHMDEIGLMVTHVDARGYLRFGAIGGVSPLTLVGSRVRFSSGAIGVIGWEGWLQKTALPAWTELFIDVGATSAEDASVGVGDVAAFERPYADLGSRLVAKAMDDRIGCAVALQALLELGQTPNDVYVVFTVQEEVGTRGATVSAYGVEPDVALAVDVTSVGDTPEARPMSVCLGQGPAIKVMDSGMIAHLGVKDWMVRTAASLDIPYQLEVLERGGTDARAMQLSRDGVPSGCLSIPCRYVHTPSEMVDWADVQRSVALLSGLLADPASI